MDLEREALLVVREVVTRRLVTVMDARAHFQEWRRRRATGATVSFLDHLVEKGSIDGTVRQKLLLDACVGAPPDAESEDNIRTVLLGQQGARTPAPTPMAPTPSPPVRPTASGRLVPAPSRTPSPAPKDDGEVELVTPGGVPVGGEPPIGTRLGRYELLEVVGRGGMGAVFKARIHPTEEHVAVKVLASAERLPGTARRARFRREIMATARLDHENIVRVRDAGHAGGIEFMVMDFVDGEVLDVLVSRGRYSLDERLSILEGVVAGVAHAHERGVIHRDLKPQNVLVDRSNVPRVVDFGLAKIEEQDSRLTRTGSALGTPFYMAPEQFTAASTVDPRADVFSLGVMLYELVTLERPFKGANSVEVADKVRKLEPPAPSTIAREASKKLDAVCARAMEKDPARRYANAGELLVDLRAALAGGEVKARVRSPLERLLDSSGPYRAPALGFLAACVIFVPLILFLTRKGDDKKETVPVVSQPPTTATANKTTPPPPVEATKLPSQPEKRPPPEPKVVSAIEEARAALVAVPDAGPLELPQGEDAAAAYAEVERAFFAPVAAGDIARARGVAGRANLPPSFRGELTRELDLLDKLRALVVLLVRADPGALGDRIDAWGGATDLGRWPRILEDDTLELREEGRSVCIRPLALSTDTLAHAAGADAGSLRGLGVLSLARREALPGLLRDEDAGPLRALASWRETARSAARAAHEAQARAAFSELGTKGDPDDWAIRFADTSFYAERRRDWTVQAARKLGPEKLLSASLDAFKNELTWDGSEASWLGFEAAFVSPLVRVDRTAISLDLSGVRLRLDAGPATVVAANLDEVSGPLALSLGRHALALDERGRPSVRVADRSCETDEATADWGQARRLEAASFVHDPTKVLEEGPPVVVFKLDGTRLAKVPVDASPPAGTPTCELTLTRGRIRALHATPVPGALEAALPRIAERRLGWLEDRALEASGRLLRDPKDGRTGLRLEGAWTASPDGTLEATGPARLVVLVPTDPGIALLSLDASAGVTLGFGDASFPAPVTERGTWKKLSLSASPASDALTVDGLLRVSLPRTPGNAGRSPAHQEVRAFSIKIERGARAAVTGLAAIAAD